MIDEPRTRSGQVVGLTLAAALASIAAAPAMAQLAVSANDNRLSVIDLKATPPRVI